MKLGLFSSNSRPTEECVTDYSVVRALLTDRGTDDCTLLGEATEQLALRCHAVAGARFWTGLIDEAEHHGVTPLVEPMITALAAKRPEIVPDQGRRSVVALTSRHRRAATAREARLDELLSAFAAADVTIILLKGAALTHLIYPSPDLRPMLDIDVLIDPADRERAVAIANDLGYCFALSHDSRFAGRMHHLPPAIVEQSGFQIVLEIHVDALSPNQPGSLTFATLADKPQRFRRGGRPSGLALGHTDMLRHLARHAFEPARRIRLRHLYDLWRYQAIFRNQINWRELATRYPDVIVILRLVSYVFAKPVLGYATTRAERIPAGVGEGMVPLSEIAVAQIGLIGKLAALFNPPAWWLHGFYGIPPERSLLICRTARHPMTLSRWLVRRVVSGMELAAAGRRLPTRAAR